MASKVNTHSSLFIKKVKQFKKSISLLPLNRLIYLSFKINDAVLKVGTVIIISPVFIAFANVLDNVINYNAYITNTNNRVGLIMTVNYYN